jgi:hypothetical protein
LFAIKWHEDGVMLIGIYVDDCLVIGTEERIAKLIVDLRKDGFNLKVENSLTDYLRCCLIKTKNSFNQQFNWIDWAMKYLERGFVELLEHQDLKLFDLMRIWS